MRKRKQWLLVVGVLTLWLGTSSGAMALAAPDYENVLTAAYQQHQAQSGGVALAVFDGSQTHYQGYFGWADREQGRVVDEQTVFEWGSITKLFVWISVMQQVEAGKLDLDTPIVQYLPEDFNLQLVYDTPITLRHLMNHQAGFAANDLAMHSGISLQQALQTQQPEQVVAPGAQTIYSNYGAALAAYVVEAVTGQDYVDYVHQKILAPLGMTATALAPDLSDNLVVQQARATVQSYTTDGQQLTAPDFAIDLYPAGRMTGTLTDLQRFAQALLQRQILFKQATTWESLFSATSWNKEGRATNAHGFWIEYPYDGVMLIGHRGTTDGFSTGLWLDLKHQVGAIVMTNQLNERYYHQTLLETVFKPN